MAIQKPEQIDMFPGDDVAPEFLTETFLSILNAATNDSKEALNELVPNEDYRETFLKLTRNLAPTGKTFDEIEISDNSGREAIKLTPHSRRNIAASIMHPVEIEVEIFAQKTIKGTLRAVHLEQDWLEIFDEGLSFKIYGVGEAVDDLIGPMVNHQVAVRVRVERNSKLHFIDIERDE